MTNTELLARWQRGQKDDVVRFLAAAHPVRVALFIMQWEARPCMYEDSNLWREGCRELTDMLAQHAVMCGAEREATNG